MYDLQNVPQESTRLQISGAANPFLKLVHHAKTVLALILQRRQEYSPESQVLIVYISSPRNTLCYRHNHIGLRGHSGYVESTLIELCNGYGTSSNMYSQIA